MTEEKLQPLTYDDGRASVTISPGPMTNTQAKLRNLIEPSARKFYSDIKKSESKKEKATCLKR